MTQQKILGSASGVGLMTLLSRFTGLLQSMFLAHFLGAGPAADAFAVAFRLPNLFRRFTAEGTMAAAFLPTLTETEAAEGHEAAVRTGIFFLGTLTLLLTFLVLGVLLFMNPITGWLTMGRDATQHDLTTLLARIMFPYLVLVSLTAGMAGLLNFKGKFILAASVSIFWNLAFILFAGGMILTLKSSGSELMETQVALICAQAVLAGGLVQLGVLVPSAFRMGFRFRPGLHFKNPWVLKALKRMAPGLITAGIYPINVLISTALASRLSDGAQVVLFNSGMMSEMVLGLFAMSVATVSLPTLARLAEEKNMIGVQDTIATSLSGASIMCIPASIGLALLAGPIISMIFYTGAYSLSAVQWTASTLVFQCVGILFIATQRIGTQALYAFKDYRGAMISASISLISNIAFSLWLIQPLGTQGLALANGLSSLVGVAVLLVRLPRHTESFPYGRVLRSWGRYGVAGVAMGFAVQTLDYAFVHLSIEQPKLTLMAGVLPLVVVGAFVYFGLLLVMKDPLAKQLRNQLTQRFR